MNEGENQILAHEQALRAWFTRDADPVLAEIDGLDIGWGGVQRWATKFLALPDNDLHLDFACGYGTFLAQLGWRFPSIQLIGLNIDFCGPHAAIRPLLAQAGVTVILVQADACWMPFTGCSLDSVSCFMGLQDIEIGFKEVGVRSAVVEAVRVLIPGGLLVLIDEFPIERFDVILDGLPIHVIDQRERHLDVRWDWDVATAAIRLYAAGLVAQMRLPEDDEAAHSAAYREALRRMEVEVVAQISGQGYYVPFGPLRMIVGRKVE
ncbi:MAG: class I SAM-dependent methyltransferase [Anaerolineales bacterium]